MNELTFIYSVIFFIFLLFQAFCILKISQLERRLAKDKEKLSEIQARRRYISALLGEEPDQEIKEPSQEKTNDAGADSSQLPIANNVLLFPYALFVLQFVILQS